MRFIAILFIRAFVRCEYLLKRNDQIGVEQIIHTSDEASTLQCAQRCKRIDKNAAILYEATICQCLRYSESGDAKDETSLTGIFSVISLELGVWGEWQDNSACSVTCGDGKQRKVRECINPTTHTTAAVKCLNTDQYTRSHVEFKSVACSKPACPKPCKKTNTGKCCAFPFIKDGKSYNQCIELARSLYCKVQDSPYLFKCV